MREFLQIAVGAIGLLCANSVAIAQSNVHGQASQSLTGEWRQNVQRHLLQQFARSRKQLEAPYGALGNRAVAGSYVIVQFTLARNGRLLESIIERGSGYPVVDSAALQVLRRASPFPPAPAQLSRQTTAFRLPVAFNSSGGPFRVR